MPFRSARTSSTEKSASWPDSLRLRRGEAGPLALRRWRLGAGFAARLVTLSWKSRWSSSHHSSNSGSPSPSRDLRPFPTILPARVPMTSESAYLYQIA